MTPQVEPLTFVSGFLFALKTQLTNGDFDISKIILDFWHNVW